MTASVAIALVLATTGQRLAQPPTEHFPLALHRSMELDDQDREIRRQHETVLAKKGQLTTTRKLADRGLVSRDDLQRETSDVLYQEAKEAEMIAYRTLKAHERDVLAQVVTSDESTAYRLLLDLLRKQQVMARVDLDYRAYRLKQDQALLDRNALNRWQRDISLLDYAAARGNVAISEARQAQVAMEIAARDGEKPYDPQEYLRLKGAYINARIRYTEIRVAGLKNRLEMARQSVKLAILAQGEVDALEKMLADAQVDLEDEKKLLDDLKAPLPPKYLRFA